MKKLESIISKAEVPAPRTRRVRGKISGPSPRFDGALALTSSQNLPSCTPRLSRIVLLAGSSSPPSSGLLLLLLIPRYWSSWRVVATNRLVPPAPWITPDIFLLLPPSSITPRRPLTTTGRSVSAARSAAGGRGAAAAFRPERATSTALASTALLLLLVVVLVAGEAAGHPFSAQLSQFDEHSAHACCSFFLSLSLVVLLLIACLSTIIRRPMVLCFIRPIRTLSFGVFADFQVWRTGKTEKGRKDGATIEATNPLFLRE